MSTLLPANEASADEVRKFISSHLHGDYILEEAEANEIARRWPNTPGRQYHEASLYQFREIFGLVLGTVLWKDEHRVTGFDMSQLSVQLPTTAEEKRTRYIGTAVLAIAGLLLNILLLANFNWAFSLAGGSSFYIMAVWFFRVPGPCTLAPLRRPQVFDDKKAPSSSTLVA